MHFDFLHIFLYF